MNARAFTPRPGAIDRLPLRDIRLPSYRSVLCWAFTVTSLLRVVSYLPTIWAVVGHADSSQHSVWTWCTWVLANLTMCAWLYESNGHRFDRTVIVSMANTTLCLCTLLLIVACRLQPASQPAVALCGG